MEIEPWRSGVLGRSQMSEDVSSMIFFIRAVLIQLAPFDTYLPQAWERLLQNRSVKWEFADTVLKRYLSVQIRPITAITEGKRKVGFAVVTINNITGNKRKENEREKLVHELQDPLAKIKTLRGLLPICASCKRIRDDKGYWNQIEAYIRDHSEAQFSHGICPECKRKLYPEFADIAE